MAMKPMRLEGILKLYIVLYLLAFILTFFGSVPMLWHVMPKKECLLFVTERVTYGEPAVCTLAGLLPIIVACAALGLMIFQIVQIKNLKAHLRNPEMTSMEYRVEFKKKFWNMLIFHCIVTVVVLTTACLVTSGYATSCLNLAEHVRTQIRGRIQNSRTHLQSTNDARYETFDTDNAIDRYTKGQYNVLGQNKYDESITCRLLLTDRENYLTLLKNHAGNDFYEQYYGTLWKQERTDQGSLKDKASKFNLVLELSMASAWISLVLWLVMLGLMARAKHHLKAPITDESMWGGSEFGGSMKSGKSGRRSQMMSPVALDYTNGHDFDMMSDRGSRISYDRGSRMSRGSRGSKGTSYKDMGGSSRNPKGSNSYKSMSGSTKKTPTKPNPQVGQLTVSMVEKAPMAKAYPLHKYLTENASLNSLDHVDVVSVADTLQGTTFGPTATIMATPQPTTPKPNMVANGAGNSLLDYFSSPQPIAEKPGPGYEANPLPEPGYTSIESGIM